MAAKTGRSAIIEQFLADGMDFMFGNPGTVEQGLLDALADYPEMKYILTLQESVAVLAGDGYARATQRPTLVQLHSCLLYTSPSPRDRTRSRMPSSA